MIGNTQNEQKLYGKTWNTAFGGYFADPEIASPLVRAVIEAVEVSNPSVIADLGGGTGFLLSEIGRSLGSDRSPSLVCVDEAAAQLDDCPDGILTLNCPVESVERSQLTGEDDPLMMCMRSVLHYFGEDSLRPALAHLRSLLAPGEYFVNQDICLEDVGDQAVANLLYLRMNTGKWYPTVDGLVGALESEGFRVVSCAPATTLCLSGPELEERYGIGRRQMEKIGRELERHSPSSRVFVRGEKAFTICLDYKVMTCVAA